MDVFIVNWPDEINWLVPLVQLVSCMLWHAEVCMAMHGYFIVPAQKSALYWPLLCPDGCHLAPFIH